MSRIGLLAASGRLAVARFSGVVKTAWKWVRHGASVVPV
jgi:hypothetical protein